MANGSILDSLPPEVLASLLQGGVLQDKGSLLDQEVAQLLAPQEPQAPHSTAMGAGLGGLGAAIAKTGNSAMASVLRKKRDANLDQQAQLSARFGELLRPPKQPAEPAAPEAPAVDANGIAYPPGAWRGPFSFFGG